MPIDFRSPRTVIQFGMHKGKMLWTRHVSYWEWLERNGCSDFTKKSIADAWQMAKNMGRYAVLRQSKKPDEKFVERLQGIYNSSAVADAHVAVETATYKDVVYHINPPAGEID